MCPAVQVGCVGPAVSRAPSLQSSCGSIGSLDRPIGLHLQALGPQDMFHTPVFLSRCSLLPARPLYVMILKCIRSPGLSPDSSPPLWASLHLSEVTYKPFLPPPRPHTLPTRLPHLSSTCLPKLGSPNQDRHRGSLHPHRPLHLPTSTKAVVFKHRPDLIFPWAHILVE